MSKPAALALTTRQRQVLDYMRVFLGVNHQLPPANKIAADFGWTSSNAAHDVLRRLERNGALQRNELDNLMLAPAACARSVALE